MPRSSPLFVSKTRYPVETPSLCYDGTEKLRSDEILNKCPKIEYAISLRSSPRPSPFNANFRTNNVLQLHFYTAFKTFWRDQPIQLIVCTIPEIYVSLVQELLCTRRTHSLLLTMNLTTTLPRWQHIIQWFYELTRRKPVSSISQ